MGDALSSVWKWSGESRSIISKNVPQYVEIVPMSVGPSPNNKPAALNSPPRSPAHPDVRVWPADGLSPVLLRACSPRSTRWECMGTRCTRDSITRTEAASRLSTCILTVEKDKTKTKTTLCLNHVQIMGRISYV